MLQENLSASCETTLQALHGVLGSELRVLDSGFGFLRFRVQGVGFCFQGVGYRNVASGLKVRVFMGYVTCYPHPQRLASPKHGFNEVC